jgi:hypothetical protein
MPQFLLIYLHIYSSWATCCKTLRVRQHHLFYYAVYRTLWRCHILYWRRWQFSTFSSNQAFATISVFLHNFQEEYRNYRRSRRIFEEQKILRMYRKKGGLDEFNKWTWFVTSLVKTSPITYSDTLHLTGNS